MHRVSFVVAFFLVVAAVTVPAGGFVAENAPPLADAGLDQRVERGAVVWLDGGGSLDLDGDVVGYEWTVTAPNGTVVSSASPTAATTSFVAAAVGRYLVTLTVTDDDGATRSDTLYVDVGTDPPSDDPASNRTIGSNTSGDSTDGPTNAPPTGRITGPDAVVRGERATFTASASDPDGSVTSFAWSNGETGRSLTRQFDVPAGETFTFSVRVTDDDGATRTLTKSVLVRAADATSDPGDEGNVAPSVRLEGPDRVAVGEEAVFVLRATDPDGVIVQTRWDGPGNASGVVLRRTFETPGTVTVSGTVVDDSNASTSAERTIEVYDSGSPVVHLSGPSVVENGSAGTFTLDAHDPDGGQLTITWGPTQSQLERSASRFVNTVPVEGAVGDTVRVTVTVTDDEGETVTVVKRVDVSATSEQSQQLYAPFVSGIFSEHDPDRPSETSDRDIVSFGRYGFTAPVSYLGEELVRVTWTFNDTPRTIMTDTLGRFTGTRSSSVNHTFTSTSGGPVSRAVVVEAVDADGDTSRKRWVNRVQSIATHDDVVFYAVEPGDDAPTDSITVPPGTAVEFAVGSYANYRIELGDGSTLKGSGSPQTVGFQHTYGHPGTYSVTLVSTQGPKGEAVKRVVVEVKPQTYVQYRYEVERESHQRVVAATRPDGVGWDRHTVHDSGTVYTGRTVDVRADNGRPAMLSHFETRVMHAYLRSVPRFRRSLAAFTAATTTPPRNE
ncbi:PKD domain-containing protein [Halobaculum limi]|uniref:PKD domain-containing protein n=1 Tax=Halobaculum limi TaxID=3031916 RepID=UPI002406A53E|nr:PKD domain-containing protein [Halobaculum sp. YSMS11]